MRSRQSTYWQPLDGPGICSSLQWTDELSKISTCKLSMVFPALLLCTIAAATDWAIFINATIKANAKTQAMFH